MKIIIEITPEEFKELGLADNAIKYDVKENIESIPPVFKRWVDIFFKDWNFPIFVNKEDLLNDSKEFHPLLANLPSTTFKRYLKLWCHQNAYSYEDRIMKNISIDANKSKASEFIRITKK